MKIIFTRGFDYKGFQYGWFENKLYRLPIIKEGRSYALKKLKKIKVGNVIGYRVMRDKKTIRQLIVITIPVDKTVNIVDKHKDIPST